MAPCMLEKTSLTNNPPFIHPPPIHSPHQYLDFVYSLSFMQCHPVTSLGCHACNTPAHNPLQSHANIHLNIHSPVFTHACRPVSLFIHPFWHLHAGSCTSICAHQSWACIQPKTSHFCSSRVFSQRFSVLFLVYGRCHRSYQAQHEAASPVQPQLAQSKEGRLG